MIISSESMYGDAPSIPLKCRERGKRGTLPERLPEPPERLRERPERFPEPPERLWERPEPFPEPPERLWERPEPFPEPPERLWKRPERFPERPERLWKRPERFPGGAPPPPLVARSVDSERCPLLAFPTLRGARRGGGRSRSREYRPVAQLVRALR